MKLIFKTFILLSVSLVYANPAKKDCACHRIPARFATATTQQSTHQNMVVIPAGSFMMGGDGHQARADELPKHKITLSSFWMDSTQVTNADFRLFTKTTHYVTTAEQKPNWEELKKQLPPNTPKPAESNLIPASLVFTPSNHPVPLNDYSQWWAWIPGTDWRHPRGPDSNIKGLDQHPVVHVSWDDAVAYCKWLGKRLPTEAEWEWAARGKLTNQLYPWGNEAIDAGKVKANTWQGQFPYKNTLRDRYYYTSPTKSFPANGYGLYDMAGNVWEWVADLYHHDYYQTLAEKNTLNPKGPVTSYDPDEPYASKRVLRGGSFLCNEAYCSGYRVAARMKSTPDTGMEHVGFRCASSI